MSIEVQKVGQLSRLVIAVARYVAAIDDRATGKPDRKTGCSMKR